MTSLIAQPRWVVGVALPGPRCLDVDVVEVGVVDVAAMPTQRLGGSEAILMGWPSAMTPPRACMLMNRVTSSTTGS